VAEDLSAGEGDQSDRPAITQGPAASVVSARGILEGAGEKTADRIRHTVWLWRKSLACIAKEMLCSLAVVAAQAAKGVYGGIRPVDVAIFVLGGSAGAASGAVAAQAASLLQEASAEAAETALYRCMTLVSSMRSVPGMAATLQQPSMLRVLMIATRMGSLRVQRIALRLWSQSLGAVDPSHADACARAALACPPIAQHVIDAAAAAGGRSAGDPVPGCLVAIWLMLLAGSTSGIAQV